MKSTGIFFAALLGLSFLASAAMLVTATMKPEWFMIGAKPQADSLAAHGKADSTALHAGAHALPGEHADSAAATQQHEAQAGNGEANHAAAEKKEPTAVMPVPSAQSAQSVQADQAKEADLQNLVKLYEAMKPEDAAKIIGKLPDKEVRLIILHIKKKQAAKILSFFDASKAAQILAQ